MAEIKKLKISDRYKKFDKIDGSHPLKSVVPKGFVDYQARIRKGGKVAYFNFELAKNMGLIPKSHENELNDELEEKLLETFSIQIINEFDQMKNRVYPPEEMKHGTYMATRYLQLQHEDKKGRTSGDGRSVWNGHIQHRGMTWDLSSCGTGGTRLSPATSKYNKFFETGDPSISYGCGYAEFDEGMATAILSKIFNFNEHSTEQTLLVIEFKNNISINVRAHQNLLRPSHLFLYLKQERLDELKSIMDYYIDRQRELESWELCPKGKGKYKYFTQKFVSTFAHLAADLEDEYIFCWLDWDGDNILMDGGIIDYGSIRQFGLFHYEYRYDDVERFSTNIIEQKTKAKAIVQAMVQAVDYVVTGEKRNLNEFSNHYTLEEFEKEYELRKDQNILKRLGLSPRKIKQVVKRDRELVSEFRKVFSYFEKAKSEVGLVEISDGVTWDAIFSMRNLLREYPQILLLNSNKIEPHEFMDIIKTQFASEEDLNLTTYRRGKIQDFQDCYNKIISLVSQLFQESTEETLLQICTRSQVINKAERVTGDAVTYIVDLISKNRKSLPPQKLLKLIDGILASQNLNPDKNVNFPEKTPRGILKKALEIIDENKDGI